MRHLLRLLILGSLLLTILAGCLPLPRKEKPQTGVLHLTDTILRGDQRWSGEVLIKGLVRVARDARLSIDPGTTVRFERIDTDGDGIGDSELLVEGHIDALGSARHPIIFTSAAPAGERKPADWKFLYLDYAQSGRFDYVVSEYAYSGIQIHFSAATITNAVFRHNVDGVRFSTANITLSASLIHHNTHGIRYEERGGEGSITGNEISHNQIGIFPVTRCEGKTLISGNNLFANSDYNVKLGLQQPHDLNYPGNFWGMGSHDLVEDSFFDKTEDVTLGKVIADQPLYDPLPINLTIDFKETSR